MSTINFPDHLPKHIVEHITSIRNYLKNHNLKSIEVEDDQLTITDLGEVAGHYALLNEGGDRWTRNISNFQRGCKKYYELIRLIVANIVGVGEYGEEWERHIKKNIFYVNIKPTYLKDINRKNWPVIQQTVI